MEALVYALRCVIVLSFTWLCVRLIGKKSISQMTSYDITALMILANVAAEPLVFKVNTKAFLGVLVITVLAVVIGKLSLNRKFYNFDAKPEIVIANSKVNREVLGRNGINLPFLLSLLRLQGYSKVSDVEFAIIEPNGNLSVIPKSQSRPVTPKDMNMNTKYEGLSLPLIIDGMVQYENLKYANLTMDWLNYEIRKCGAKDVEDVFLAEIDGSGELFVNLYDDDDMDVPGIF